MLMLFVSLAMASPSSDRSVQGLPHGLDVPCGTPSQWGVNDITPLRPSVPPPPDGKGVRDAWGAPAHSLEGERFVIKWGDRVPLSDGDIQSLMQSLDTSWEVEIDDMEHQAPKGSTEYLFNVYIGNSGGSTPSIDRAAAYYTRDRDGWPMIVVHPNTLDNREFLQITAAHEFYHAVQGATNRYNYQQGGASAWFWESTATWASSVVFEDNPNYTVFLFGYAFYPHLPVNFFDYPDTGALTEYYQYGSFLFPLAVSDESGSWDAIADTWKDTGSSNDPLEVLRLKLRVQGIDLDELWMRHNARNATWDYPYGDLMRMSLAEMSQYPGYNNMVAASVPSAGMSEPRRNPPALAPARYGYNTYSMSFPQDGDLLVTVDGDAVGSDGSPGSYGAYVVVDNGAGDLEYHEVPFEGTHGELDLGDVSEANSLYLVVGSWTPFLGGRWQTESFSYSYMMFLDRPPEPDPVEPEPKACGCDGGFGVSGGALWLPLGLFLFARRRQRSA
ncbi:MAG: hypothetical protein ACI9MC_000095 [Kiritimatiellia bacterium]|jgi:hypothetical protein